MVIVPIPFNVVCVGLDIVILVLFWRLLLAWWQNTPQLNAIITAFNGFIGSMEAFMQKVVQRLIHRSLSPRQRLALVLLLFIGVRLLLSGMVRGL